MDEIKSIVNNNYMKITDIISKSNFGDKQYLLDLLYVDKAMFDLILDDRNYLITLLIKENK